jgi:hypothetical protein
MKGILIMIFLGMLSIAPAQNRKLIVEPVVGNIHVRLDETLNWGEQGTLTFTEFKCYFSKLQLEAASGKQLSVADSIVLIDLSSDTLPAFSIPNLDGPAKLSLLVGLDSVASTSGAMGGKLDPMYGMYWSWQSGYINLKLSGTWERDGRTQAFTYHLGGYQKTLRKCAFIGINDPTGSSTHADRFSVPASKNALGTWECRHYVAGISRQVITW